MTAAPTSPDSQPTRPDLDAIYQEWNAKQSIMDVGILADKHLPALVTYARHLEAEVERLRGATPAPVTGKATGRICMKCGQDINHHWHYGIGGCDGDFAAAPEERKDP